MPDDIDPAMIRHILATGPLVSIFIYGGSIPAKSAPVEVREDGSEAIGGTAQSTRSYICENRVRKYSFTYKPRRSAPARPPQIKGIRYNGSELTDIGIFNLLQGDAKYTLKEIAHKLHRNKSVIDRRIEWLEQNGYVSRYVALIDAKKIKGLFTAFPLIQLADHREETFIAFQLLVLSHKEVMECHHVMGDFDFLLIVVSDAQDYNDF